jgi:hypothetical protein
MNPWSSSQVGMARKENVCGSPGLDFRPPQDTEHVRHLMAAAFPGRIAEFELDAADPPHALLLASYYTPATDSEGKVKLPVDIARCRPRTRRQSRT